MRFVILSVLNEYDDDDDVQVKSTTSPGDSHEPLDLSTARSDSESAAATSLPSPAVSDQESKPAPPLAAAVTPSPGLGPRSGPVPCRRSSRQRRRTAKAAGEDACVSVERDIVTPRRQGRSGGRPAYVCQLCDKEFTKHSSLVRHTYQHSG